MRHFVVHGHTAPTDGDFALDDLASGAGRLDLLARSLLAGMLLSHDVRRNTIVHLVHADTLTLRFDGRDIRSLHPDERSAAALIRSVLGEGERAVGEQAVDVSPGIDLRQSNFESTLQRVAKRGTIFHLDPDASPAITVEPPETPIFVLSDHQPFSDADREVLDDLATRRLSLGPEALHTDQTVTVAHHWCDTGGWTGW